MWLKKMIGAIALICFGALGYYALHPAVNIHQQGIWLLLFLLFLIVALLSAIGKLADKQGQSRIIIIQHLREIPLLSRIFVILAVMTAVLFLIGELAGATLFRSRSYASLLPVEERVFEEDIAESDRVTDIALMDTESARIFGSRKIGSLSDVVSQYEVEPEYTQIAIQGKPWKVSGLKYASFFKWWNNRKNGIPGYVKVDPTNSEAQYVKLDQGMRYVPSGYFNYNLQRHVQLKYPTKIFDSYHFELDDEGNPFYICPTKTARIGLFDGMDINGAVICDPISGDCKYYDRKDIPSWADSVYSGHLLTQKYNWHGMLSGGYFNSIFEQKGCKQATDDFGYKIILDDVWIYTGVTSVNGDKSNIGFIMMNQRTSEAKFYRVSGAEEHSAMAAAEGEVQEKGYRASFPSLINVAGIPTYVMVLKDSGGLVKLYAMVNVEQYNIVATAATQSKVFENYLKLLKSQGNTEIDESRQKQETITVTDIQYIDTDDGVIVYLKDNAHQVYKQAFKENESLIKITAGDQLRITYLEGEDGIHTLLEFTII